MGTECCQINGSANIVRVTLSLLTHTQLNQFLLKHQAFSIQFLHEVCRTVTRIPFHIYSILLLLPVYMSHVSLLSIFRLAVPVIEQALSY